MTRSRLGSVTQTPSGRWQARVSMGRRRDGRRRTVSRVCDTRAEAQAEVARIAAEMGASPVAGDGMTLADYYHGWFVPAREARLTRATMARYDGDFRRVIAPALGARDMASISHGEVQALVDSLTRSQAQHVTATLRAILRSAWDDGLLAEEPMRHRLRMPPDDGARPGTWDAATVAAALPLMEGVPIEALWLCMVGGGLRREEAYALYWGDLSFDPVAWVAGGEAREGWACSAVVDDAVTDADGRKATKTAFSRRVAAIGEPFSSRLRALSEGRGAGEPVCPVSLSHVPKCWRALFTEPAGERGRACSTYRGRLASLPYVPLSRMRATHETLLQAAGVGDALNNRMHGRAEASPVSYTNYLDPATPTMRAAAAKAGEVVRRADVRFA